MPKLMLINPHPPGNRGEEDIKVIVQMPLNLGYLSALTPKDEWEVDLIDEAIEPAIDDDGNCASTPISSGSPRSPTRRRGPTRSPTPPAPGA